MRMYLGLGLGQTNLLFSFLGRSKKCCGVGGDVGGGCHIKPAGHTPKVKETIFCVLLHLWKTKIFLSISAIVRQDKGTKQHELFLFGKSWQHFLIFIKFYLHHCITGTKTQGGLALMFENRFFFLIITYKNIDSQRTVPTFLGQCKMPTKLGGNEGHNRTVFTAFSFN